ncbi:M61 family metallopeptidase [Chthonomonas calidirosea]|uniref:M61 family metallopeptidase n=1 Tax=Chthonomonas calidirosea TaxID=454171 RepID=UPI0006EC7C2A|nr:M61 family metallopeptidase [Chthonomonas calidirosea]CEK13267.1 predicted protease with the C-terminal PDZ domain [Chthonomonas calidirosea]
MRIRRLIGGILLCYGLVGGMNASAYAAAPSSPRVTLTYCLRPILDNNPYLEVTLRVPKAQNPCLQMPVWCPGDYHVQNFAQYVSHLQAEDEHGNALTVRRSDENTWQVQTNGVEDIVISYRVSQEPPGIFCENVQIKPDQVFVSGTAAFLYVVGEKEYPTRLEVEAPKGWQVIVPLVSEETAEGIVYCAEDYDALADSPILLATPADLLVQQFVVDGIVHRVVFFDHPQEVSEPQTLTRILQRIVQAEGEIMGGLPYAQYIFYFDVDGRGGGLEHRNSARLVYYPEETLTDFAAFAAHEFFHLWNVKRIRPRVLGPFDYIHPPHTRSLWFVEGVTDYFAWLSILRAGLITPQQFLAHWRRAIQSYLANPAHLQVSAEQASWHVWDAGNSEGYEGLSYYDKGALIGLCLDLELRYVTHNDRGLADVMRLLLRRYAPPHAGYTADELRDAVNEVARTDLSNFYNKLTQTTEEMPFGTCLAYAGLDTDCEPILGATEAAVQLRDNWLKGH